jgi:hypothetical protein
LIRKLNEYTDPVAFAESIALEATAPYLPDWERPALAKRLRASLRRREDVYTVLHAIGLQLFRGTVDWTATGGTDAAAASPQALLFKALGFDRAFTDRIGDVGPWIREEDAQLNTNFAVLRQGGLRNYTSFYRILQEASDDDLVQARNDTRLLIDYFRTVIGALEAVWGAGSFGFGFVHWMEHDSWSLVMFLPFCIAMRRAGLGEHFTSLQATVETFARPALAVLQLRQAFPEYCDVLRPTPEGQEALRAMSDEDRQRMATDITTYLERHPEIREAIETVS